MKFAAPASSMAPKEPTANAILLASLKSSPPFPHVGESGAPNDLHARIMADGRKA